MVKILTPSRIAYKGVEMGWGIPDYLNHPRPAFLDLLDASQDVLGIILGCMV